MARLTLQELQEAEKAARQLSNQICEEVGENHPLAIRQFIEVNKLQTKLARTIKAPCSFTDSLRHSRRRLEAKLERAAA